LRSTELVRDFSDPHGLRGYCLTDFGRSCLSRISDGFRSGSARRAWRLTGDFGSGKSSFALLLAHSMGSTQDRLPKSLLQKVVQEVPGAKTLQYIPVLVTGTRERMAPAVLRAVYKVLGGIYSRGTRSELENEIAKALSKPDTIKDTDVIEFLDKTTRKIIQNGKASGILLILDEVGKFLEFAANNPEVQDVYFLQQLAELASRSGKQPIVVVCLLHQGFNAYAEQLAPPSQKEWEKIAGRFEEIVFRQPLDQVATLISSALNLDEDQLPPPLKKQAIATLDEGIRFGWFGTSASRETMRQLAHRLFPLDPLLLPVLVRTFQRFAQNERSLFSFLCSYEPFGLRAFSDVPLCTTTRPYQLADFYDYIRANFGHRLAVASYRTHWNVIESKIDSYPADRTLELRVLKTIGVLNLLNADDLRPTRDAVCWAVGGNSEGERQLVSRLLKKLSGRELHFRGETRGYSLWPYTSVDIDGRLSEAGRAIPQVVKVAEAIRQQLDCRPVVARAHYINTGNLRYFDVVYCEPEELAQRASEPVAGQADGIILVPLCETRVQAEDALRTAQQINGREDTIQIVAVPRPLSHLNQAALDALRWEWVQENTQELNNDPYARDEVQLYLQEARNRLQNQIQEFIGLNRFGGRTTLSWFYRGALVQHHTGRQVMRWLSDLCDDRFSAAPKIRNELVNRHNLSAAATAARIRLIELMFINSEMPDLGLPKDRKPPERSMYLSVLGATGLHRQIQGRWQLAYPPDDHLTNALPALRRIIQIISATPDTRVPITQLLATLRRPPYGLRDGLFPILLAVVAIVEEQEIAFYENGTFLRDVGRDAFLRMTRAPERFDIQYCRIEGVRSELFAKLIRLLDLSFTPDQDPELLDVVRKLCQFVANLPEYARNTKRLSATAIRVRDVILEAREPARMIFHDLPTACGFAEFHSGESRSDGPVSEFICKLKDSLDELRNAVVNLHARICTALSLEFDYDGQPASQYRPKLAKRARQLLVNVTENKMTTFANRLFDETLLEPEWLESLGSFLAVRPPSRWKDQDEDYFERELASVAGRFKRAETIGFRATSGQHAMRVSVTRADGCERQEVIHFEEREADVMGDLEAHISELIKVHRRVGIAAASRAIWSQIHSTGEQLND
jgi:hypothetical protein